MTIPARLAVLTLSIAACTKPSPTTAPPAADAPDNDPALEQHMQAHFFGVSAVKDAVIDGDLETLAEQASTLASDEDPAKYPVAWRPHVVSLVEAAEGTAASEDMTTAATRTADLAANCGRCHRAVEAQPSFQSIPEPRDDASTEAAMERHQWAADRMWEGIVGPSDDSWVRGTRAFVTAPGCAIDPEQEHADAMVELCNRLGGYGTRAAEAKSLDDRARIYGEFLQTCAECHNAGA